VRTKRCALVAVIFSAFFFAGCGEDESPKPVNMTPQSVPAAGKDMLGEQAKKTNIKTAIPDEAKKP